MQFGPDKCKSMLIENMKNKFNFFLQQTRGRHLEDRAWWRWKAHWNIWRKNRNGGCGANFISRCCHFLLWEEHQKYYPQRKQGHWHLNSLLRGSSLYTAEAMINMKKDDFRKLEQIEEDQMRLLFETDRSCPIHIMYLETGK